MENPLLPPTGEHKYRPAATSSESRIRRWNKDDGGKVLTQYNNNSDNNICP